MLLVEHIKVFKRAILWIELVLLALAVGSLFFVASSIALSGVSNEIPPEAMEQALTWPAGLDGSLSFAAGPNLGGLLMVVLVGAVVAQELFLVAKFAVFLLPALLIVLTALIVGGALSGGFSLLILGEIPFAEVAWAELGWKILIFAFSLLPYAALTFFLAVASRSTVLAVGGGLAYALLLEGIALQLIGAFGGVWGEIGRYLPGGLARGMLSINSGITVEVNGSTPETIQFLEPGAAAIGTALYILVFVAAAMFIFRRQDLNV
jgi:hypothetical protein